MSKTGLEMNIYLILVLNLFFFTYNYRCFCLVMMNCLQPIHFLLAGDINHSFFDQNLTKSYMYAKT